MERYGKCMHCNGGGLIATPDIWPMEECGFCMGQGYSGAAWIRYQELMDLEWEAQEKFKDEPLHVRKIS